MTTATAEDRTRALVPSGQLVTFLLEGVEFGLDIDRVQEITPRTDITPVPGAPSFVLGVINLRGIIIPVLDARLRFHLAPAEPSSKTRIMVLSLAGQPTGLQVDAVAEVIRLEDFNMRDTPPLVAGVRSEYLAGMVMAGSRLITLIDLDRLLDSAEFAHRDSLKDAQASSMGLGFVSSERTEEIIEEKPFVTFALGSESLGVTLDQVEEVIELPPVTRVPDAPDYVLGVICLREQVLPLLDLARLLSVSGTEDRVRDMVVLLSFGGSKLGIAVDGIQEIVRVKDEEILPPPHTVGDQERNRMVGVVIRPDRMVTLLDVLSILSTDDRQKLLAMGSGLSMEKETEKDEQTLPLVVFHLGEEAYGLRLEEVREVIRVGLITPVPRAPSFVDGVINLRGEVMPVVDLRTRFGLPRVEPTALSRILICAIAGVNTGLVLDSVDEVKSVPLDSLGDPPRVTSVGGNRYIEKVARTASGMVFLLAIQELLTDTEEKQLQALQGRKRDS
jgi:purine-binding chemotaxis protein CheW